MYELVGDVELAVREVLASLICKGDGALNTPTEAEVLNVGLSEARSDEKGKAQLQLIDTKR